MSFFSATREITDAKNLYEASISYMVIWFDKHAVNGGDIEKFVTKPGSKSKIDTKTDLLKQYQAFEENYLVKNKQWGS